MNTSTNSRPNYKPTLERVMRDGLHLAWVDDSATTRAVIQDMVTSDDPSLRRPAIPHIQNSYSLKTPEFRPVVQYIAQTANRLLLAQGSGELLTFLEPVAEHIDAIVLDLDLKEGLGKREGREAEDGQIVAQKLQTIYTTRGLVMPPTYFFSAKDAITVARLAKESGIQGGYPKESDMKESWDEGMFVQKVLTEILHRVYQQHIVDVRTRLAQK